MKTVIFDMDGVLVDSEPLYADAWIQVYKEIGIGIDHDYYFSKICGKHGLISTRMVLEEFCRHEENIDKKNLNFRKEQISAALVKERISPMPGAVQLVSTLSAKGYKLGLSTTSLMVCASSIISHIGLDGKFRVMHAGDYVKHGKPHPEVYLITAKMLEAEPEECVVIEDSKSGMIAAKAAQMKVIGVLNGRNKREDLVIADVVVNGLKEITPELIESL